MELKGKNGACQFQLLSSVHSKILELLILLFLNPSNLCHPRSNLMLHEEITRDIIGAIHDGVE
jgi:hypothetical protein